MARRLSVLEYFDGDETLGPMELVHGIVHEPPAPRYGHQSVVTRTTAVLDQHGRERELGIVCVSPKESLTFTLEKTRSALARNAR